MFPTGNSEAGIPNVSCRNKSVLQIDRRRRRTVPELADNPGEIPLISKPNDWWHQKLKDENGGGNRQNASKESRF